MCEVFTYADMTAHVYIQTYTFTLTDMLSCTHIQAHTSTCANIHMLTVHKNHRPGTFSQQETSVKSEATIVGRSVPKANPSSSQSRSYPDEPQTHSVCGMYMLPLDTLSLGCNQCVALASYHLPLGFLFKGACYYLLPPGSGGDRAVGRASTTTRSLQHTVLELLRASYVDTNPRS